MLNQKGGVGKTTSVVNIAAALAAGGSRVIVLDFDPQAHLTIHLGLEPQIVESGSYKVLTQGAKFEEQIMLMRPNLWLLPANINLVGAESELVSVVGREIILREAMMPSQDKFDYCLIDSGPSLGILTLNALAAAQDVLIPLQPHFLALRGLGKLLQTVELVNKRINPNLRVKWVLLCMFDSRASLPNEVKEDISQFLANAQGTDCPWSEAKILPVHIRRNIKLAEAPSYGKTIFEYEQNCNGAQDYKKVAEYIHAQFFPPTPIETQQAAVASEKQEQAEVQTEQQPSEQPVVSETVVINETQERPAEVTETSEQPETKTERQVSDEPAEPEFEPQVEPQPDTQPEGTDENQKQPPIEIKSISPEQQQKEGDVEQQPSEFTQTTSEQSST